MQKSISAFDDDLSFNLVRIDISQYGNICCSSPERSAERAERGSGPAFQQMYEYWTCSFACALGLTRGQIAGLITGESLLMGLLAGCVAIPTGVLMAWVLIRSVQRRAFGWTMPFSVDSHLLLQTLLVGLLAAGLAAITPAWRSAQRDPAPQLRQALPAPTRRRLQCGWDPGRCMAVRNCFP